jgi:hypothetical protein
LASAASAQVFLSLRRDWQSGVEFGIQDSGLSAWNVYGDAAVAGYGTYVIAPTLPDLQTWHHVAYVYDGAHNAALYIDGALVATGTANPGGRTPLSAWIGSVDGVSSFYSGDMDEIRVWNIVRSASDIAQEAEGLVPANAPGLVAYFKCDGAVGTRVLDSSGNGNDMTLGGGDPARMPTFVPSTVR